MVIHPWTIAASRNKNKLRWHFGSLFSSVSEFGSLVEQVGRILNFADGMECLGIKFNRYSNWNPCHFSFLKRTRLHFQSLKFPAMIYGLESWQIIILIADAFFSCLHEAFDIKWISSTIKQTRTRTKVNPCVIVSELLMTAVIRKTIWEHLHTCPSQLEGHDWCCQSRLALTLRSKHVSQSDR